MYRTLCKSKIHQATVTQSELYYEGSITIDSELMKKADIVPYEKVQVVDINNGNRFETYAIEGPANGKGICVNGAAARLVSVGDKIIIFSYGLYDDSSLNNSISIYYQFKPKILLLDDENNVK
jgi:aspartate 1-decarboxylase